MDVGRPKSFATRHETAAASIPVSLVGQDRRLSPARPGFNSRTGKVASRAPLAERSAVNRQVLGSIPSGGDYLFSLESFLEHNKSRVRKPDTTNPWRNGSASDSRPEGWGFKSLWVHSLASRAPLAERSAVNRQVLGSIPSGGVLFLHFRVILFFLLPARFTANVPVAKWIRRRFPEPKIVGSSPTWDGASLSTHSSSLAVEHRSYEPGVAGSIPAWSMPGACSVMVIIGASQALDPGSIPGRRSERVLGH